MVAFFSLCVIKRHLPTLEASKPGKIFFVEKYGNFAFMNSFTLKLFAVNGLNEISDVMR